MDATLSEDIRIRHILTWCENLAELGCPREAEPDMWFRELEYEGQVKVVRKMAEIDNRYKQYKDITNV